MLINLKINIDYTNSKEGIPETILNQIKDNDRAISAELSFVSWEQFSQILSPEGRIWIERYLRVRRCSLDDGIYDYPG